MDNFTTPAVHRRCTSGNFLHRCIFGEIAKPQNCYKISIELLLQVWRYSCRERQSPKVVKKMQKAESIPSIGPYKLNCKRHYFPPDHPFHLNQAQVHQITLYSEHLTSLQAEITMFCMKMLHLLQILIHRWKNFAPVKRWSMCTGVSLVHHTGNT